MLNANVSTAHIAIIFKLYFVSSVMVVYLLTFNVDDTPKKITKLFNSSREIFCI